MPSSVIYFYFSSGTKKPPEGGINGFPDIWLVLALLFSLYAIAKTAQIAIFECGFTIILKRAGWRKWLITKLLVITPAVFVAFIITLAEPVIA